MDFPVASLQKMHMEEKHKVGDNFVCTKCPETSKDVTNFLKHLYNHDKPRIICDHCGKGFRNLSQLKYVNIIIIQN